MGIIGSAMGRPVAKGAGRKARARSGVRGRADDPGRDRLLTTLLSRLDNVGVLVSDHAGKIVTANPAWWTLCWLPPPDPPGRPPPLPPPLPRGDRVGVLVSDHAGKIVPANPAWWTLLGLPRRYSPGKGVTVAFPPVLRSQVRSLLEKLGPKQDTAEPVLADGGLPLPAPSWHGGALFFLTEQPLVRERALTQKILDSLPLGLYVIDRSFTIVAWNRTRETAPWGMKRQEVIGRNLFEVLPSLRRGRIEEEFRQVFETGATLQMEEESVLEGDRRTFRISKAPLTSGPGEVTHVITLVEDITERRRIQRQLLASEKLAGIGQLASGIAHELNNPMAAIASCAEALLK